MAESIFSSLVGQTFGNPMTDKVKDKATRLQDKKNQLLQTDILGYYDADTPVLGSGVGSLRESPTSDVWYDAAEMYHGDTSLGENKSDYSMELQRRQAAEQFGIPVEQVSDDHIHNLGSRQLVNKLYLDTLQEGEEPTWQAPLIDPEANGRTQLDLTPETYAKANASAAFGQTIVAPQGVDKYDRVLGSTINPNTGMNTTDEMALDKSMNARLQDPRQLARTREDGLPTREELIALERTATERMDTDNMFEEAVDVAQSSIAQWWGTSNKTVSKLARNIMETLGADEETAEEWFPKDGVSGIVKGHRFEDLMKREYADAITGVKTVTREEQDKAQAEAIENIKNKKYGDAVLSIFSKLPLYIADSAGETLSLATVPTAMLTIANRTSEQAEEYEKNNNKPVSTEWILGSLVTDAGLVFGERFIIGKGLEGVLRRGSKASQRAKSVGASVAFEIPQEMGETIKEKAFTQEGAFTPEASQTLAQIATEPETQFAGIAAGMSAGALSGTGQIAAGAKDLATGAKQKVEQARQDKALPEEYKTKTRGANRQVVEEVVNRKDLAKQGLDKVESLILQAEAKGDVIEANKYRQAKKELARVIQAEELVEESIEILGNEQDTVDYINSLLSEVDDINNEQVRSNIDKIAKANNLSQEQVDNIYKDQNVVEREATWGPKGYKTYERQLRQLKKDEDSNSEQIALVTTNLITFQQSQQKKVNAIKSAMDNIVEQIEAGTIQGKKMEVPEVKGQKGNYTIYFDKTRKGYNAIHPATIKTLEDTQRTITEINRIMQEQGVTEQAMPEVDVPTAKTTTETEVVAETEAVSTEIKQPTPIKPTFKERAKAKYQKALDDGYTIDEIKKRIQASNARDVVKAASLDVLAELIGEESIVNQSESGTRIAKISGREIKYTLIEEDSTKPLASNTKEGIKLQKNLTPSKVIAYMKRETAGGTGLDEIISVKKRVNDIFKEKFGIEFSDVIKSMNDTQVRQFILLHEDRYNEQIAKRTNREEFVKEYKKDPVKFELDANVTALKRLGLLPSNKAKKQEQDTITETDIDMSLDEEITTSTSYQETLQEIREDYNSGDEARISKANKTVATLKRASESIKKQVKKELNNIVNKDKFNVKTKGAFYLDIVKKILGENSKSVKSMGKLKEAIRETLPTVVNMSYWDKDLGKEHVLVDIKNNEEMMERVLEGMTKAYIEFVSNDLSSLGYLEESDVQGLLGLGETEYVTWNSIATAREFGKGRRAIAAGLGADIARYAGFGVNDRTIPARQQAEMEAVLGAMLIDVLEARGAIEQTEMPVEVVREIYEQVRGENAPEVNYGIPTIIAKGEEDTVTTRAEAAKEIDNELLEISPLLGDTTKGVRLAKMNEADFSIRRREELADVSKEKQAKLLEIANQEYEFNTEVVDALDTMNQAGVLEDVMGKESTEGVRPDTSAARESSNNRIKRSINGLLDTYKQLGKNRPFYFDWFLSSNGRNFIDSNVLNPQNDKLHRFAVNRKGDTTTIDSGDKRNMFKLAVVQAFDGIGETITLEDGTRAKDLGSIDKQSLEKSLSQFTNIIKRKDTVAAMEAVKGKDWANKALTSFIAKTDHPSHALMALIELQEYSEAGSFDTRLTLEADAVTSGVILGLLSMPVMDMNKLQGYLQLGGVWLGGANADSFGSFIETTNDIYKKGAVEVDGNISPEVKDMLSWIVPVLAENGQATKDGRSFMKSPLMVFNYGAGNRSIKAAIAREIVDKYLDKLDSSNGDTKTWQAFWKNYDTAIDTLIKAEEAKNKPNKGTVFKLKKAKSVNKAKVKTSLRTTSVQADTDLRNMYNGLIAVIENTYGDATINYLTNEFEGVVKARKGLNRIYELVGEKFTAEYNKAYTDGATKEELGVLVAKAKEEGFLPVMNVGNDNAVIINRGKLNSEKNLQYSSKVKGKAKKTIAAIHKVWAPAHTSAGVNFVHWTDGKVISENTKGLGIHDAKMLGIGYALDTAKTYQTATWENTVEADNPLTQALQLVGNVKDVMTEEDMDMVNELKVISQTIDENKAAIKAMGGSVEHMSLPGSKVEIEGKEEVLSNEAEMSDIPTGNLEAEALDSTKGIVNLFDKLRQMVSQTETPHTKHLRNLLGSLDTKFLGKMKVYLNDKATRNGGYLNLSARAINLAVNKGPKTRSEMDATEVYAHEIIHAFTAYAEASTNVEAQRVRRKIRQIQEMAKKRISKDKLPNGMWDYIFEGENSLREFIAHATTNEAVMNELKKIGVKEKGESLTLLDSLVNLLKQLFDIVTFSKTTIKDSQNTQDAMMTLTFQLMEFNNKAVEEIEEKKGLGKFILNLIETPESKFKEAIDRTIKRMAKDGMKPPEPPRNASRWELAKWYMKFLPQLLARDDMKPYRAKILSAFKMKPEGFVQNVLRDIATPDKLERIVEQLGMMSDIVDQKARSLEGTVAAALQSKFKKELTTTEKEVLTEMVIDIDLQGILEQYGAKEVAELLTDPKKLKAKIEAVKRQLEGEHYSWYTHSARGLANYMVTGYAGLSQNLNAENIAKGRLTGETIDANAETIQSIDELATLYAIDMSKDGSKSMLASMLKNEEAGVIYLAELHRDLQVDAKAKLFKGNGSLMVKGYSKEIFDNTVSVVVKPLASRKEMEAQGYFLVKPLGKSANDKTSLPMGLYKSKNFMNISYYRSATRLTNIAKRGTSVTDTAFMDEQGWKTELLLANRSRSLLDKKRAEEVKRIKAGKGVIGEEIVTPLMDEHGNVVDYRYMMSKADKKILLEQDTRADKVIARSYGSVLDKTGTIEQNRAVMDVIFADMEENYIEGSTHGKNNMEYVKIEKDSYDKTFAEIYRLLPDSVKEEMAKRNLDYLPVRRDMLLNYFGFRNSSITNLAIGKMPLIPNGTVKSVVRGIEAMWQEFIKIAKVNIVIRIPAVLMGNIMSNIMVSVVEGKNPIQVIRMQLDNARWLRQYLNDEESYRQAQLAKNDKEVKRLKRELERNPVHELMEAGMYQPIIEDIGKADFESSNRVTKWVDKKMEGLPTFVKNGANWLYLTEKTGYFKFITQATQYSDFVARATQNQLMKEKGIDKKKRMEVVLDSFVNYNKPATSIEEWFNQMGFMMFTKYAKRIQRAIGRQATDHPIKALLYVMGQEYIGIMPEDIYDQSVFSRSWYNIGLSPLDHVMQVASPAAVDMFTGGPLKSPIKFN